MQKTMDIDQKRFRDLFAQVNKEMSDESDRAVIIVGAARLEILLSDLLNRFMIPCSAEDYEMFKDHKPVSSFYSKIVLAYRCGLISSDSAKALQLVRKIRNEFAHKPVPGPLDSGTHADRLKELESLFPHGEDLSEIGRIVFEKKGKHSGPFRFFVLFMITSLAVSIERIKPVQPQDIGIFEVQAVADAIGSERSDAAQP